jgi:hypothetical protein
VLWNSSMSPASPRKREADDSERATAERAHARPPLHRRLTGR